MRIIADGNPPLKMGWNHCTAAMEPEKIVNGWRAEPLRKSDGTSCGNWDSKRGALLIRILGLCTHFASTPAFCRFARYTCCIIEQRKGSIVMPKQWEEMTQAEKIEELHNDVKRISNLLNHIQAEAEQRVDQLGRMVSGAYRRIEQAERRMGLLP
jgi:hypothetical protein